MSDDSVAQAIRDLNEVVARLEREQQCLRVDVLERFTRLDDLAVDVTVAPVPFGASTVRCPDWAKLSTPSETS
jgi:hypothetical protein